MSIYILLIILNIFLLFIKKFFFKMKEYQISTDNLSTIIMIVLLGILMGGRASSVGIDTRLYERIYVKISQSDSLIMAIKTSSFFGPGYVLFCWMLQYLSNNPRTYIVVSSIIMSVLLYKFAMRQENALLFLFYWQTSYLYAFSMNGNRQVFSTLLITEGIVRIDANRKDIVGIILVTSGLFIHPVSVCVLVLYFVAKTVLIKYKYIIILLIGLFSAILVNGGMTLLIKVIVKILPGYAKYVNGMNEQNFFNNSGGGRIVIFYIFVFTILILFSICSDTYLVKNRLEKCFLFSTVFIIILGITNFQNTSITRLVMFILPQGFSIISRMKGRMSRKSGIVIQTTICIVMFIYVVFNLLENKSGVVPYEMFI